MYSSSRTRRLTCRTSTHPRRGSREETRNETDGNLAYTQLSTSGRKLNRPIVDIGRQNDETLNLHLFSRVPEGSQAGKYVNLDRYACMVFSIYQDVNGACVQIQIMLQHRQHHFDSELRLLEVPAAMYKYTGYPKLKSILATQIATH
jgi:hypothetical protein